MSGTTARQVTVGRSYTAGRRQPYLIRKWPGSRFTLPLGPYTLTQLVIGVGSVLLLVKTRMVWAHLGPVNLIIAVGVPVVLTYAARRTRVEGRDPLRSLLSAAAYLLQPRAGYLRGQAWRLPAPVHAGGRDCVVVSLDELLGDVAVRTADPQTPVYVPPRVTAAGKAGPGRQVSLAELLRAAERDGR